MKRSRSLRGRAKNSETSLPSERSPSAEQIHEGVQLPALAAQFHLAAGEGVLQLANAGEDFLPNLRLRADVQFGARVTARADLGNAAPHMDGENLAGVGEA